MTDETFAESLEHARRPYRVLGMKLRPFSYWHAVRLDILSSPFVGGETPLNFLQLYLAAKTCQTLWPQRIDLTSVRSRLGRRFLPFVYGHRFLRELKHFSDYLADYNSGPIWGESENTSTLKAPWYLVAVCRLRSFDPGLTWAQAWDTEVGYGNWLLAAYAEARGEKINIMTPEDRAAFREAGYEGF